MKRVIPLLYTMDDNYSMQAGVSLCSLFENNQKYHFCLYVISDGISNENKSKLMRLCQKYDNEFIVIEMPDLDTICGRDLSIHTWAKSAYCRLFLTELLPKEIDRLIYFDPDTIIVGKIDFLIKTLFSSRFSDYYAAACIDIGIVNKKYKGFKRSELYFNTGVLLVNLQKWREDGLFNIFISEIKRRNGRAIDVDQCYINCICINKILKLPAKYNVMPSMYWDYKHYKKGFSKKELYSKKEVDHAVKHPVIVHFCRCGDSIRPWFLNSNHPMKEKWNDYFKMTEWRSMALKEDKITSSDKALNPIKRMVKYIVLNILNMGPIICLKSYKFYPKLYRR